MESSFIFRMPFNVKTILLQTNSFLEKKKNDRYISRLKSFKAESMTGIDMVLFPV